MVASSRTGKGPAGVRGSVSRTSVTGRAATDSGASATSVSGATLEDSSMGQPRSMNDPASAATGGRPGSGAMSSGRSRSSRSPRIAGSGKDSGSGAGGTVGECSGLGDSPRDSVRTAETGGVAAPGSSVGPSALGGSAGVGGSPVGSFAVGGSRSIVRSLTVVWPSNADGPAEGGKRSAEAGGPSPSSAGPSACGRSSPAGGSARGSRVADVISIGAAELFAPAWATGRKPDPPNGEEAPKLGSRQPWPIVDGGGFGVGPGPVPSGWPRRSEPSPAFSIAPIGGGSGTPETSIVVPAAASSPSWGLAKAPDSSVDSARSDRGLVRDRDRDRPEVRRSVRSDRGESTCRSVRANPDLRPARVAPARRGPIGLLSVRAS